MIYNPYSNAQIQPQMFPGGLPIQMNQQPQIIPAGQPQPQPVQQVQQTTPQQIGVGFISVSNEQEARSYPVAPGNSITFRDENGPYIYTKTMGYSQLDRPTFEKFRLVKEEQAPAPTPEQSADLKQAPEPAPSFPDFNPDDFALKEDIEKLKREIEELKKEQRAHTPAPMRRAGKQEAKKNE